MSNTSHQEQPNSQTEKWSQEILDELEKIHTKVDIESMPPGAFGRKVAFEWIPRYENNILAFVYLGAAFLVIVLGLRGLGSNIPEFLKSPDTGRLYNSVIYIALLAEFFMISLLALTMYFKIEDHNYLFDHFLHKKHEDKKDTGAAKSLEEAIEQINKDYDELKSILHNLSSLEKKLHT